MALETRFNHNNYTNYLINKIDAGLGNVANR